MRSVNELPRILVVGLGNELLTDDGAGVHAIRLLEETTRGRWTRNVVLIEVGVAVLDALDFLEWADRILVLDAMNGGEQPGTIYLVEGSDIQEGDLRGGLHELNLLGALRMSRRACTPQITVLGIEPALIDYGMEMTSIVKSAIPRMIAESKDLVDSWNFAPFPPSESWQAAK